MIEVDKYVSELKAGDIVINWISLDKRHYGDSDVSEVVDCLLARPDAITMLSLSGNEITDETGVKLAPYVAISSTIRTLMLAHNRLTETTYLALAKALRTNTSLEKLSLVSNQLTNTTRIEAVFVEALRINPNRPNNSSWWMFGYRDDFNRLKTAADTLGALSLLSQLDFAEDHRAETKTREI